MTIATKSALSSTRDGRLLAGMFGYFLKVTHASSLNRQYPKGPAYHAAAARARMLDPSPHFTLEGSRPRSDKQAGQPTRRELHRLEHRLKGNVIRLG
jgi:hypothetical protein